MAHSWVCTGWTARCKDWINKEDIYINQERINWGIICYVLSVKSLDCCALCDQGKNKTYNLPVWIVFHTTSSSCNHVHDVAVVQHQCFNSDMIRCKDRLEMFQYILKAFFSEDIVIIYKYITTVLINIAFSIHLYIHPPIRVIHILQAEDIRV